jgi:DNA polymerase-3 subunit epsilon
MFLFFDTETTGVPKDYKAPITNFFNWPRMVQLGFQLWSEKRDLIVEGNYLIKPLNFVIPNDATKIHGITTEQALCDGVFLQEALTKMSWVSEVSHSVVCHNFDYDSKIVGCELLRCGLENFIDSKKKYCTMKSSKEYVGIVNTFGYKWPQLKKLYWKLFEETFEGAHDAMADIRATARCFWKLVDLKIIVIS